MDTIEDLIGKIRKGLTEDQQLKVLASLYGPMARRMQGLEDAILFILERTQYPTEIDAYEVGVIMQAMGYRLNSNGKFTKTHEVLPNTPVPVSENTP